MDTAVFLALLGFCGTVVGGLFKLMNKMTVSLDANTASNKEIAKQTKKGADEAKQRNGHLAELVQQGTDATKLMAETATKTIVQAVQNVQTQKVEHQEVASMEIKKK